ncbi:phosphonate transport system substrate-binding protein [Deinococcus metalli]|uniref:Phosphonate ABC transporter substrate-binding protein n=1 Tax=Deinococcus metalli TaxID=1141878 RepID=A0A7W8KKX2_9DEIO|nr:phosphonate ABC transporter substrate-binding protein [Deinococcus metalli]MBB5379148.1 phosphonate transport system substrate-binding protein [Deinococcus metalli]GHF64878.1 phosphonate ABC transporter substrate-binding protein [Deinococcus metalli]
MSHKMLTALALAATLLGTAHAQDKIGWPTVINFGLIPTEGSSAAEERFKPLFDYIEKSMGVPVKAYVGADYAAVILAMQNKKLDIGYFGPKSYIEAADRAGAVALVKDNAISGGTGYNSILISKAGGPIKTFADAKGMDFAFVDPNSTSGYLVPLSHFLLDLKVKPEEYFKRVTFAGSHENVVLGVANGTIPIGATNNLDLDRAVEKGAVKKSDLTVLWTSKVIPSGPIAVRKDLPVSFQNALKAALLKFNDAKGLEQLQLKGYAAAADGDYDPIRDLNKVTQAAKK